MEEDLFKICELEGCNNKVKGRRRFCSIQHYANSRKIEQPKCRFCNEVVSTAQSKSCINCRNYNIKSMLKTYSITELRELMLANKVCYLHKKVKFSSGNCADCNLSERRMYNP